MSEVRELGYVEAIHEAQLGEMRRDPTVVLIGEDIHGLTLGPYAGLEDRLWSAPISESGFTGMAVGAALTGLRPIVDLLISSLLYVAMDPLVNQAAKLRAMTGGQARVPLVIRSALWHGGSYAAQHSDRPYPMFMNAPGLKVAVPATPADAAGLLRTAVRDDDPVMIFEDRNLARTRGPVPEDAPPVAFGAARRHREGSDVTLVARAPWSPSIARASSRRSRRRDGWSWPTPRTAPAAPRPRSPPWWRSRASTPCARRSSASPPPTCRFLSARPSRPGSSPTATRSPTPRGERSPEAGGVPARRGTQHPRRVAPGSTPRARLR